MNINITSLAPLLLCLTLSLAGCKKPSLNFA